MSREQDERELRKLEFLERRGVATLSDVARRKVLARKLAIEDFDEVEETGKLIRDARRRLDEASRRAAEASKGFSEQPRDESTEKKGSSN